MTTAYVSVEVDFWAVWNDLTKREKDEVYQQLRLDYGDDTEPLKQEESYRLDDPVQRLAAITELRALGYTVETA